MRAPLLSLLIASLAHAQSPRVDKVEPPSWWLASTWSPVRLLIRGENLKGAALAAQSPLIVTRVASNGRGSYLFADLIIPRTARPGSYKLTVKSAGSQFEASFEVLPALVRENRFQGFGPDDILYLIMPDRYSNGDPSNDDPPRSRGLFDRSKPRYYHGGDFQGIINRAPYLHDLGVTAVWLNPWYDNVDHLNAKERYNNQDITDYHGYGAVDFYGVEEHFGDMALLQKMSSVLGSRGIKLIQDQVANHSGPYHLWVQDPPTATWYNGTADKHLANDWQTWTLMDPHASPDTRRTTLDGWFINILPDLNQNDPEARRYVIQNSLWWTGAAALGGIRQDTLPYAPRDYWRDWMRGLKREFPRLTVVGEVLDGNPAFVSFFQGGRAGHDGIDTGIDAMFDFPLMFAMRRTFAEGQSMRETARVLAHDWLYPNPQMLVTFLGLHDVARFMNERNATVEGIKLAYTFLFTTRGIPMVYYGDEIAMPGANDPDNRRDFPETFSSEQKDVLEHVKRLIALRKSSPALRRGKTANLLVTDHQWAYARTLGDEKVVVVLNKAPAPVELEIPGVPERVKVPGRSSVILNR